MKKPDPTKQLAEQSIKRDLVSRNSATLEKAINSAISYWTSLFICPCCTESFGTVGYHFYDERIKLYMAMVSCICCGYTTEHRLDILLRCTKLKLKLDVKWR